MKRDMNIIRDLLFEIERKDDGSGQWIKLSMSDTDHGTLVEHLILMNEAGLVDGNNTSSIGNRDFQVRRLTWLGHDFLDSVRDPDIWEKTKNGASVAGDMSLDLIKALAKGLVKKQVEQATGIELDL